MESLSADDLVVLVFDLAPATGILDLTRRGMAESVMLGVIRCRWTDEIGLAGDIASVCIRKMLFRWVSAMTRTGGLYYRRDIIPRGSCSRCKERKGNNERENMKRAKGGWSKPACIFEPGGHFNTRPQQRGYVPGTVCKY